MIEALLLLVVLCTDKHLQFHKHILLLPATDTDIRPLKPVLNKAIRSICNLELRTHIIPFYKQFHLFLIRFRIKIKACMIAFKIFRNIAPIYVANEFEVFQTKGTYGI